MICRHRWYIGCSRLIFYLCKWIFQKYHQTLNYLPRTISMGRFTGRQNWIEFFSTFGTGKSDHIHTYICRTWHYVIFFPASVYVVQCCYVFETKIDLREKDQRTFWEIEKIMQRIESWRTELRMFWMRRDECVCYVIVNIPLYRSFLQSKFGIANFSLNWDISEM
jgi:hypothetical protein